MYYNNLPDFNQSTVTVHVLLPGNVYCIGKVYLNLRQQVIGTEKRIAYLFVAMERELKDLQFYVCSVS